MRYVGIDLHKRTMVVAVEDSEGPVGKACSYTCQDVAAIRESMERLRPFRAVIEASSSYRWLHELLSPLGEVVLAHPRRLRAITDGRAKTDKLDAALLAKLLRADLIPKAHVPSRPYAQLRDLTRARARLSRHKTQAKNELHALLTRDNIHVPYKVPFRKRWTQFVSRIDLGPVGNIARDEILRRIGHYDREMEVIDAALVTVEKVFPEVEAITGIHGIGLYTALLIIAEIAEPWRFDHGRKVGAYAGLTPRVSQSGGHCYHGHITRQGSPWLRWALVQVAMHVTKRDQALQAFYTRIRKRSSAKIARVAVARKLAEICWQRIMAWHRAAVV